MATPLNYSSRPPESPRGPRRRHSLGGPVVLILLGVFLLLGNLHVLGWPMLRHYFAQYWPALLILWGLVRLYEHLMARRAGQPQARMGAGGGLLIAAIIIVGLAVAQADRVNWDSLQLGGKGLPEIDLGEGDVLGDVFGQQYAFSQELEQPIAADAVFSVNSDRGTVTISTWEQNRIRVVVSKKIRAESQTAAAKADASTQAQLGSSGKEVTLDANTRGAGDIPVQSDVQIFLPAKVALKIAARGDITVRSRKSSVNISSSRGNVILEDVLGDATLAVRRGDVNVLRVTGDVVMEGTANDVTISDISGAVRLNGGAQEWIRLARITQGVSYQSSRTTLQLARLDGELAMEQGDLHGSGVGGPTQVTTRSKDIRFENVTGDLDLKNANGDIQVRVTRLPVGAINIANRHADIHVTLPARAACQVNARNRSHCLCSHGLL